MSNLYYFLESNELLDVPNEEAAGYAASVTASNIQSADARTYFREQLLWYWKDPTTMGGAIQDALDGGALPADLVMALGEMWSSLFGQSATILRTSSDYEIAKRIFDGKAALQALGIMTQEQVDGFYDLGGSLSFPGTTAADVQQAKDDHAAQEAAAAAEEARLEAEIELRNEWETAMMDAGAEEAFYNGDKAALIVAINAAVAEISVLERG